MFKSKEFILAIIYVSLLAALSLFIRASLSGSSSLNVKYWDDTLIPGQYPGYDFWAVSPKNPDKLTNDPYAYWEINMLISYFFKAFAACLLFLFAWYANIKKLNTWNFILYCMLLVIISITFYNIATFIFSS